MGLEKKVQKAASGVLEQGETVRAALKAGPSGALGNAALRAGAIGGFGVVGARVAGGSTPYVSQEVVLRVVYEPAGRKTSGPPGTQDLHRLGPVAAVEERHRLELPSVRELARVAPRRPEQHRAGRPIHPAGEDAQLLHGLLPQWHGRGSHGCQVQDALQEVGADLRKQASATARPAVL